MSPLDLPLPPRQCGLGGGAGAGAVLSDTVDTAFRQEQRRGLTVALQGRLVVLLIIALWIGTTRFPPSVYYMLGLIAAFGVIGLAQLWVVARNGVRAWQLYLFTFVEVSILAVAIAAFTGPFTNDIPVPMGFRFTNFLYFFLFIASAAFSYAPGLVLWSGVSVAIAWSLASVWVVATFDTIGWTDLPDSPTTEQFLTHVLNPMFFGVGSRMQEMIVLLSVAGLLAVVVWRARRVVIQQAQAERDRAAIAETFGRYVPEAVARQLIDDSGALAPQEREATILMTDIENFTGIAETMAPADVLAMLDEYFDLLGRIVAEHGGVVGQFHGDALIATFNVPVPDPDHARAAVRAACAIERALGQRRFHGHSLRTRIGINTGLVVSGSVGSSGRRSYTVYGDVVNAAARIEATNKEFDTTLLVSSATADACGSSFTFEPLGRVAMRGKSEPMEVLRVIDGAPVPGTPAQDKETL